ncbi:MAG TPA: zeta toxin family protein, partial [Actinomycetota bacterium]|nr:zeta toxin family protein [Actinomycetota bacterium]
MRIRDARDSTATTLTVVKPISNPGAVYLISGPMAAGKSKVARLLAQRFDRGVHLEGDLFRQSI